VLAAQRELAADGFVFAFLKPGQSFADYVRMIDDQRHGRNLDAGMVEATWLLADVDGVVVGRSSIRFELNASLLVEGGHVRLFGSARPPPPRSCDRDAAPESRRGPRRGRLTCVGDL
jgi:hypothetical protein